MEASPIDTPRSITLTRIGYFRSWSDENFVEILVLQDVAVPIFLFISVGSLQFDPNAIST
jgi:hypothetical protein